MQPRCIWSPSQDSVLQTMIEKHGPRRWEFISSHIPGKTAKQCRERWYYHLDPSIRKGSWTPEEDQIISDMVSKIGTKWAQIARELNGRTDNAVKNRFHSAIRKNNSENVSFSAQTEEQPPTTTTTITTTTSIATTATTTPIKGKAKTKSSSSREARTVSSESSIVKTVEGNRQSNHTHPPTTPSHPPLPSISQILNLLGTVPEPKEPIMLLPTVTTERLPPISSINEHLNFFSGNNISSGGVIINFGMSPRHPEFSSSLPSTFGLNAAK